MRRVLWFEKCGRDGAYDEGLGLGGDGGEMEIVSYTSIEEGVVIQFTARNESWSCKLHTISFQSSWNRAPLSDEFAACVEHLTSTRNGGLLPLTSGSSLSREVFAHTLDFTIDQRRPGGREDFVLE